eukprot:g69469.t1
MLKIKRVGVGRGFQLEISDTIKSSSGSSSAATCRRHLSEVVTSLVLRDRYYSDSLEHNVSHCIVGRITGRGYTVSSLSGDGDHSIR